MVLLRGAALRCPDRAARTALCMSGSYYAYVRYYWLELSCLVTSAQPVSSALRVITQLGDTDVAFSRCKSKLHGASDLLMRLRPGSDSEAWGSHVASKVEAIGYTS